MTGGGFVLVFVLVFAVGAPLLLWVLIDSETDNTDVMDRRRAEESARADSRGDAERRARWDTDDDSDRGF